jgi:hypothetical protein
MAKKRKYSFADYDPLDTADPAAANWAPVPATGWAYSFAEIAGPATATAVKPVRWRQLRLLLRPIYHYYCDEPAAPPPEGTSWYRHVDIPGLRFGVTPAGMNSFYWFSSLEGFPPVLLGDYPELSLDVATEFALCMERVEGICPREVELIEAELEPDDFGSSFHADDPDAMYRRPPVKAFDCERIRKAFQKRRGLAGTIRDVLLTVQEARGGDLSAAADARRALEHLSQAVANTPPGDLQEMILNAIHAGRCWERLIARMKYDADVRDKNHQRAGKARENAMVKAMFDLRTRLIQDTYRELLECRQRLAEKIGEKPQLHSIRHETAKLVSNELRTRFGENGERLDAEFGEGAQALAKKRKLLEPVKPNSVPDIISGRSAKRSRKKTAGA